MSIWLHWPTPPPDPEDLAAAALEAAAASTGSGRLAWTVVAFAVASTGGTEATARVLTDEFVRDSHLKVLTRACLGNLFGAARETA